MMHKSSTAQVLICQTSALPAAVTLGESAIDLRWNHVADFSASDLVRLESFLSPPELDHVSAAKTEVERKTRLVARALLKDELGRRTGTQAARLELLTTPAGKPFLPSTSDRPVWFSLAHSHGWIVHAFSDRLEIGVDLEHINRGHITHELLQDVLTKEEQALTAALPEAERATKFFQYWTAKESVLKAAGAGFSGLHDLTEEDCSSFSCFGKSWKTMTLTAPSGFVAALAWEDEPVLSQRQGQDERPRAPV
jgi:phosphopantetheinyl transferase